MARTDRTRESANEIRRSEMIINILTEMEDKRQKRLMFEQGEPRRPLGNRPLMRHQRVMEALSPADRQAFDDLVETLTRPRRFIESRKSRQQLAPSPRDIVAPKKKRQDVRTRTSFAPGARKKIGSSRSSRSTPVRDGTGRRS